jgi:dethiobiotin synthetase
MNSTVRKSFFVTGTDTDVGKTLASCAMLRAASAAGYSTVGMKPLAAGGMQTPEGLRNDDALQLQAASSLQLSYDEVNPVCLPEAASPHIAAALAQRKVRIERLAGFCQGVLSLRANLTLLEGAGGWRVPLNEREFMSDLAKQLQLPVIIVVGMRLGCLNHTLLTGEAVVRDGLRLAGWIANRIDPHMEHYERNRDTLREWFPVPLLAELPYFSGTDPTAQAAGCVALDQLMQA